MSTVRCRPPVGCWFQIGNQKPDHRGDCRPLRASSSRTAPASDGCSSRSQSGSADYPPRVARIIRPLVIASRNNRFGEQTSSVGGTRAHAATCSGGEQGSQTWSGDLETLPGHFAERSLRLPLRMCRAQASPSVRHAARGLTAGGSSWGSSSRSRSPETISSAPPILARATR
jgi:hypothetical protein